ncbi:hypothetical protein ABMX62_20165 [Vibrio vulnificus]|uniref:hypothetical protein n=1 Tax=Vibrio vulnificus TaxID=672 RepID=UPI004058E099
MVTDSIRQADKAKAFDWLVSKLEDGTLEMLFKGDDSGDVNFDSVSSFDGLVSQLEVSGNKPRPKKMPYILVTPSEFSKIEQEICSSYSQSGCMDDEPREQAEKAHDALIRVLKRNGIYE